MMKASQKSPGQVRERGNAPREMRPVARPVESQVGPDEHEMEGGVAQARDAEHCGRLWQDRVATLAPSWRHERTRTVAQPRASMQL